jgi:protein-histidine N-methyltransferase
MSAFTFDFDLEDDLDESFDAIPLKKSAAAPPSTDETLAPEGAPISSEIPAEEIQLSALVRPYPPPPPYFRCSLIRSAAQLSALPEALSYSPLTLPGPNGRTLARRDLFDVRFQLLAQGERDERDERTAAFVDAPADLISGAYEGGLKTWECALDLAAYLDRDVLGTTTTTTHAGAARRRMIRGSRVLEVSLAVRFPSDDFFLVVGGGGADALTTCAICECSWVAGRRCPRSSS